MGHFSIHAVAIFLVLSTPSNAVVDLTGAGEDATALVQHSLTGTSRVQHASKPSVARVGDHLKPGILTAEEKAKERQRQKRKAEREAKAKGCPPGFYSVKGDVPGPDQFGREKFKTDSIELCAEDCQSKPECTSFEWSPNAHLCNANHEAPVRLSKGVQEFMLCVRNETGGPPTNASSAAGPEVSLPRQDAERPAQLQAHEATQLEADRPHDKEEMKGEEEEDGVAPVAGARSPNKEQEEVRLEEVVKVDAEDTSEDDVAGRPHAPEDEVVEGVQVLGEDRPKLPVLPKYAATSLRLSRDEEELEHGEDGFSQATEEQEDKRKQVREEAERRDKEEAVRQETEAKREALREEQEWAKRGTVRQDSQASNTNSEQVKMEEHMNQVMAQEKDKVTERPQEETLKVDIDEDDEGGGTREASEATGDLQEQVHIAEGQVTTRAPRQWEEEAQNREKALERAQQAVRRKQEAQQDKEAVVRARAEARKREAQSKDVINVEDAASEDEEEAARLAQEAKIQEENRRRQAEIERAQAEQARIESEERATRMRAEQERAAREAAAAQKAEEDRKAAEEAKRQQLKAEEEEKAKEKVEEDAKQEDLVEAIRRAEENDRQEAEERAKQEAEEEAKRIQELQKKEEEEERLRELEKINPEQAARERRRNELHARMAAALERKRIAAEKKRKIEEEAGRQQKAIEDEQKRKQAVIEEHQRAMEEERRRKREEMQAAQAIRQAEARAAQEASEREAEERRRKESLEAARQIQLHEDEMEQKVMAASRPFAAPKRTTASMVTLRFQDANSKTVLLKVARNMRFKVMMNAACSRLGILLADAQFTHGGRRLDPNSNPEAFGLGDLDLIKVTDFIKVDDLIEQEEAKEEDAAAKAAREMFEAAQREWEGGRKKAAEPTQAEKKAMEEKAANNTLVWEANTRAALQSLPAARSFDDARRKAREVVKLMDEDEIMGLIYGSSSNQPGYYLGNTLNVTRFDIPALRVHDSTFRFRKLVRGVQKTVTCWPSPLALASTWDDKLVGRVAGAMAKEMREKGTNVMLGPSIGVIRVAAGGRNFEQLSGEDPYLGSRMVTTYVQAVQKAGIMAAVRPFGFYNQETGRKVVDVEVSEKVAWELYYPPFEAAVRAGVSAVVCSNVKVNGTGGCENAKLLKNDLKGAMGFQGFVMSEELLSSVAAPIRAGMDSALPGSGEKQPQKTSGLRALNQDEKREAATRVLTSIYQARMDEMPMWQAAYGLPAQKLDARTSENVQLAYQAAASAITLLKNDGVLPLNPSTVRRLAVFGPAASMLPKVVFYGGDYYSGGGPSHIPATNGQDATALDHIMRRASEHNIQVITGHFNASGRVAKETAMDADVVVVVGATTSSEGADRTSLALDDNVDEVISAVAAVRPTVVLMQTPGAVVMPWRADVSAAANLFLAGEATGRAWAAMLFGDISPSGRLPLSMPKTEDEQIRPKTDKIRYSEGLRTSYRSNTLGAAFTFGHGLSYTEFTYGRPDVVEKGCLAKVCVRLEIVNTGKFPGAEVVQAYVQFATSESMPRILRGFYKTAVLQPQQREEAYLVFTTRDLSTYHDGNWVEQTDVKVDIGPTSADVRQTMVVNHPMRSLDLDLELS